MISQAAQPANSHPFLRRPGRFLVTGLAAGLLLGLAGWYFLLRPAADGWSSKKNDREHFLRHRIARLALLPPSPVPPKNASAGFNSIDAFLADQWEHETLPEAKSPPRVCDDTAFLRRVYLDLMGMIPSREAAENFLKNPASNKRETLVDTLLARDRDYAAHWTAFWEDALASGNSDYVGGVSTHGTYRYWLQTSLAENKPYDLMVAELLDPTMPGNKNYGVTDEKKRVGAFLHNRTPRETIQSAANVGQVFLGTGMKCAGCHNHFLNKEWPQKRFLAFAGLLGAGDLELVRCEQPSGKTVPSAFPFELPGAPRDVPKFLDERLHRATLLLIDPTNPRFARTVVNRLWKRYLGLGLFEPVDDFRADRPATNPALLDWLADDFMRHGYDLKHTIRLILTSRAYQLTYNPELEDRFDVEHPGAPRYFRSPALRRLTAEQFIDSLEYSGGKSHRRINRDDFAPALAIALGRPASRQEVTTSRSDDLAVVQALELLNGTELHDLVYSSVFVEKLASLASKESVTQIYWTVLSRPPTEREQVLGGTFLAESEKGENETLVREKIGDMLWALFVSPEFQYIR